MQVEKEITTVLNRE